MLEEEELKKLQKLAQKAFEFDGKLIKYLDKNRKIIQNLEAKNNPRVQFDLWKKTQEGKEWKQKQYFTQQGLCVQCKKSMPLKGSHIDHIQPISIYPELALVPNNMQLLCPECNVAKGKNR